MHTEIRTLPIKLAGSAYLVYIGWQTFTARTSPSGGRDETQLLSAPSALRAGFLTNALNPKTTMFVVSVYAQVVGPGTPLPTQIVYGLFMSLAHWLWFSMVSLFLSDERLRARLLQHQVMVNRCIGVVLVALGFTLAVSSATS